jgi:hypothetical protein
MNTPDGNDPLARRARAVFASASDDLDPAAANRLRLARRAALAGPPMRRPAFAPIAGAIAIALAALWLWPRTHAPATAPATVAVQPPRPVATPAPVTTVPPAAPTPDAPDVAAGTDAPVLATEAPDDEFADDALELGEDEEDAEVYAWLADAPVAPDDGADAL